MSKIFSCEPEGLPVQFLIEKLFMIPTSIKAIPTPPNQTSQFSAKALPQQFLSSALGQDTFQPVIETHNPIITNMKRVRFGEKIQIGAPHTPALYQNLFEEARNLYEQSNNDRLKESETVRRKARTLLVYERAPYCCIIPPDYLNRVSSTSRIETSPPPAHLQIPAEVRQAYKVDRLQYLSNFRKAWNLRRDQWHQALGDYLNKDLTAKDRANVFARLYGPTSSIMDDLSLRRLSEIVKGPETSIMIANHPVGGAVELLPGNQLMFRYYSLLNDNNSNRVLRFILEQFQFERYDGDIRNLLRKAGFTGVNGIADVIGKVGPATEFKKACQEFINNRSDMLIYPEGVFCYLQLPPELRFQVGAANLAYQKLLKGHSAKVVPMHFKADFPDKATGELHIEEPFYFEKDKTGDIFVRETDGTRHRLTFQKKTLRCLDSNTPEEKRLIVRVMAYVMYDHMRKASGFILSHQASS